jgi:hypothetical protein
MGTQVNKCISSPLVNRCIKQKSLPKYVSEEHGIFQSRIVSAWCGGSSFGILCIALGLKTFLPSLLFLITTSTFGQGILDIPIRNDRNQSAISFFSALEKTNRIKFCYREDWIRLDTIRSTDNGKILKEVLDAMTDESLSYMVLFDYQIVFTKDPSIAIARENLLYKAAAAKTTIERVSLGSRNQDYRPGKQIQLTGRVQSEANDEPVGDASILVENLNISAVTDARGQYRLTIPAGEHVLSYHSQNYSDKVIDLRAYKSGEVNITLEEAPTVLQEVVVSDQAILTGRAGQSSVLVKNLKRGPTFLGEADIIKNLQVQPGVTSVGEVSAGFNVRGGGTDQNLVLLDGIPIFNTSHALGFFSGFNPEAIGNVSFYRGGIPAEFGSRVSSVLTINSKEGDYKKWSASGGMGIISSHLTVGGPIKRDTSSITASFRSSYSNWLLRSIRSNFTEISNSSLAFLDGSVKFAHRVSQKTKIQLSGYHSFDEFSLATDTLYQWKNTCTTRNSFQHLRLALEAMGIN